MELYQSKINWHFLPLGHSSNFSGFPGGSDGKETHVWSGCHGESQNMWTRRTTSDVETLTKGQITNHSNSKAFAVVLSCSIFLGEKNQVCVYVCACEQSRHLGKELSRQTTEKWQFCQARSCLEYWRYNSNNKCVYSRVAVQLPNHLWPFVTLCTIACQGLLSFTISWCLLKLMSIELVLPSNHLVFCCPLLLLPSIFTCIRVFSSKSVLCIMWPKYWSFSFRISPSNEYPGLISFTPYFK